MFIRNPQEKIDYFHSVDWDQSTWITSDLNTKLYFQGLLLQKNSLVEDTQLIRIHEFWRKLLNSTHADLKWVSSDFSLALVTKFLEERPEEWAQAPGVPKLVMDYLQNLMPVVSHGYGDEAMDDWFKDHPDAKQRWAHWYGLTCDIWKQFQSLGVVSETWASGLLVNQEGFESHWKRKLIFDLGSQVQPIEIELIQNLSRYLDVEVLIPITSWSHEYKKHLKFYSNLYEEKDLPQVQEVISTKRTFKKFTTQLSEVKDACSQVRSWLDQGVPLEEIAILAPDIGLYGSALSMYLEAEGIPGSRPAKAPFKTFHEVEQWISQMKIRLEDINTGRLETVLFRFDSCDLISHDKFRQLFSRIYSPEDLERNSKVKKEFSKPLSIDKNSTTREEFIRWAFSEGSEKWDYQHIVIIVDNLREECPAGLSLNLNQWVQLVDRIASKNEISVEDRYEKSILCADLASAKDTQVRKAYLMGMSETQLRSQKQTLISDSDVDSMVSDFGMITHQDNLQIEFETRWFLENKEVECILSYPQADFDGKSLGPSILWLGGTLKNQGEVPEVSLPGPNRLDQFKNLPIENLLATKETTPLQKELFRKQMQWELGQGEDLPWSIDGIITSFSPTNLEDYLKCPFVYASKKLFKLSDLPDVDLDVDVMTRGMIVHSLFEILTDSKENLLASDEQVLEWIKEVFHKKDIKMDKKLWTQVQKRYLNLAKMFMQFERNWREKFPQTHSMYAEEKIVGFVDTQSGALLAEPSEHTMAFSGKPDRIDVDDQGRAMVIDYKFSKGNYKNFNKWIEEKQLQLGLYAIALENGLLEEKREVVGCVYYAAKTLDRNTGFLQKEDSENLVDTTDRKKNKISREEKEKLFQEIQNETLRAVEGALAGVFKAEPFKEDLCDKCNWRNTCRAPHLM